MSASLVTPRRALALATGVALLALALLAGRGDAAPACTITWDGPTSGGQWSTDANWDTNVLPGAADHACIPAGNSVTHSTGTSSVLTVQVAGTLRLTGGTLNLTSTADPAAIETLEMTGGVLGGAGTAEIGDQMSWSGGSLTDAGTTRILAGSTLTHSAFTSMSNGRVLDNAGLMVMSSTSSLDGFGATAPLVRNTGEIRGTSTGTTVLDPALDNEGLVTATSGVLDLQGGSGSESSTGDFGAAGAAGTVNFDGGTHALGDGARWLGGVDLSSGEVAVTGGTATASGANSISGGVLRGTGTFRVLGALTWSSGSMTDAGVTEVTATGTLTHTAFTSMSNGRVLANAGLMVMSSTSSLDGFGVPAPLVRNTGEIRGTSTGTTVLDPALDNDGLVRATSGVLDLQGGSGAETSTGDYGAAGSAGTVNFDGGTHTLGGGASWLGGVDLSSGEVSVSGGTATASGANSITGGVLRGAGNFDVGGNFTWSSGNMTDAGTTRVLAGGTLTHSGFTSISNGRVLANAGLLVMSSTSSLDGFGVPAPLVRNTGEIRGTSASTTVLDPALDNDGLVRATSGVLDLQGGSGAETSTGDYGAAGAAGTVNFDGGTHTLGNGASWLGGVSLSSGEVSVSGGTANTSGSNSMVGGVLSGAGDFDIGGPFSWSSGNMTGAGTTSVLAGATLTHGGFTSMSNGRVLDNAGLLLMSVSNSLDGFGTPAPLVHNSGEIRGTAASGAGARLDPALDNDGLVRATSTVLDLTGGSGTGTSAGDYGAAGAAGTVRFDGGTHTLANGAALLGATEIRSGRVDVPAGLVTASGSNALGPATLGGAGTLEVSGTLRSTGSGTMIDAGLTRVLTSGKLELAGGLTLRDGRRVENRGLLEVQGDHTVSSTGVGAAAPSITNTASGTVRKTTGAGSARIVPALSNAGLVDSVAGKLELDGDGNVTHTGRFKGSSETALPIFGGGTHVLADSVVVEGWVGIDGFATVEVPAGATLDVNNQLLLAGGTLGGAGTVNVPGLMKWTGGEQAGPGTTLVPAAGRIVVDGSGSFCSDGQLSNGRLLDNRGTVRVVGSTAINAFDDPRPVIENSGRLEFDDTATGGCGGSGGIFGNGLIHNTGTIEKLGGSGEVFLQDSLDNDGQLIVTNGSASLSSISAVTHTGSFRGTGGPVIFADGRFEMGTGATIAGSVTVEFATLALLEGMTLTVEAPDELRLEGGSIEGGDLRVLGTFTWEGGRRAGPGTTLIEPGADAVVGTPVAADFTFVALEDSNALVNRGDMQVFDGTLDFRDGASLLNAGTLDVSGGSELSGDGGFGFGFSALLHNTGTLRKVGGSDSIASVALDNDGTIEVTGGGLRTERLLNWSTGPSFGESGSLTGGTWIVRDGTQLWLPGPLAVNSARLVLDGPGSSLLYEVSTFPPRAGDALATLVRNAGAGRLEVLGGRQIELLGALRNNGTLRIGPGSVVTANGGYSQTAPGAVLRIGLNGPASTGRVRAPGSSATLGGILAAEPGTGFAAGQEFAIVEAPTVSGTFATVTGTALPGNLALQTRYEAPGVKFRVVQAGSLLAAPPEDPAEPPATGKDGGGTAFPARVRIDDRGLRIASGPWDRTMVGGETATVATEPGAALVRRNVRGRRLMLIAYTCRRCGSVAVYFRGRLVRRVALHSRRPGRRALRIASFGRMRTGTLRLRTMSARRVAIDALVIRSPQRRR